MPTTTPAAIPVLLVPLEDRACVVVMIASCGVVWPGAVTMIVLALVTTDGGPLLVCDAAADNIDDDEDAALPSESESESELESEPELWLATLLSSPVSWTDQELGPPPVKNLMRNQTAFVGHNLHVSKGYPLHFELHWESETLLLDTGSTSPHQQLDPMDVPITGFFWPTHSFWQYPGD